jgi:hypothetical protein
MLREAKPPRTSLLHRVSGATNMRLSLALIGIVLACSACGMPVSEPPSAGQPPAKITFDLSQIDADGLAGAANGRVAISYEFCIPTTQAAQDEVRKIDPTITFQPGARGRVGCTKQQILAIGNTQQPNWRAVLQSLAGLEYIARIDRSDFE